MTKLVTGIEAIQSGKEIRKPFGFGTFGGWHKPDKDSFFTFTELTTPCFEIKQEPREFYIGFDTNGNVACASETKQWDINGLSWIKVREVVE